MLLLFFSKPNCCFLVFCYTRMPIANFTTKFFQNLLWEDQLMGIYDTTISKMQLQEQIT